ncbi:DUF2922 domain-containing protein [Lysinibacillus sp. fkY74-1]|uniref:DUF2922 domain-containing protein n=3 Tax=Lysinibacillus TaxID=400634 RepID=B1HVY3_LYSSC|nr:MULTISPECIES: DUF2922 domain-containing protein [Lysinibacillus]MBE5082280.1 DUF2922 domain-containing protein [Bacillus thuringiensis]UZM97077.1 DUF2922 domain-containing protein [Lysinibacillus sp. MHQ-1]ACA39831.1 conserved hypothetical protein [Lysinibacillus sphaericus C3-41]AMO34049.1 hypothetical protein AR327_17245 [Lysinibacillus sphaericus]AMR90842.1 hypothetical protein A1T07_11965 [Lysinibacillus sphaericus]
MTQVLELQFVTADGKTSMLTIDAPKPTVTAADIQQVMKTIMAKNVFSGQAGALTAIKGARIVERKVIEFDVATE